MKCDIYVKILIGNQKFQTTYKENNHSPNYFESFDINGVRIFDNVTLELWDFDHGVNDDDLLWKWTMTINDLFKYESVVYQRDTDFFTIIYCVNWYNDDYEVKIQKCPESK